LYRNKRERNNIREKEAYRNKREIGGLSQREIRVRDRVRNNPPFKRGLGIEFAIFNAFSIWLFRGSGFLRRLYDAKIGSLRVSLF
jgi:hypothetical protein